MRTVLAIALGVALSFSAQASSLVGSITGRAVNAAGGAVTNQRVDLVRGGQVVNVATTNAQGAWSFGNVAAGDYVVRTSVNGKLAGVRVSVAEGASVSATTIVVPTAAVAPQFGALAGLVASMSGAAAGAVAQAAVAAGIETDATNLSAEQVVAIFNALPLTEQLAFAAAVTTSSQVATSGGADANGGNAFKPVANTGGTSAGAENNAKADAVFNALQSVASPSLVGVLQSTLGSSGGKLAIDTPAVSTSNGVATASTGVNLALPGLSPDRFLSGIVGSSAS